MIFTARYEKIPILFVNRLEQIECIQAEVHGAAGWIEEAELPWIFDGPMGDVDWLLQQLLLRQVLFIAYSALPTAYFRGGLAIGEEDLGGAADEVATLVLQARLPLSHFVPDAAEGIVREEFDDVARGEELVTDGEFAGIAWRGGFGAHFFAFVGVVVVLVDPADGFVFCPEVGDGGAIEFVEELVEGGFGWEEEAHGV
jgi:hypothetical protein